MKPELWCGVALLIIGIIVTNKARDPVSANYGMIAAGAGFVTLLVCGAVAFVEWV